MRAGEMTVMPRVYVPELAALLDRVDNIERLLVRLVRQGAHTMSDLSTVLGQLDRLEVAAAENTAVDTSAALTLDELSRLLHENSGDQEAVNAIADRMAAVNASGEASNVTLREAIVRNTPADPNPPNGGGPSVPA